MYKSGLPNLIQVVFGLKGNTDVFELLVPGDVPLETIRKGVNEIQEHLELDAPGAIILKPGWSMGILGRGRVYYDPQGEQNV